MTLLQAPPSEPAILDSRLPDEWGNERFAEIPIQAEGNAYMLFGMRGSGKSAVMAGWAKKEAELGKRVWYWPRDYRFKYGEPIDTMDLYTLPEWLENGVLLIDEIQVLMSNLRTMSTANQMGSAMLQQVRKRGLTVYGTSNQPARLDKSIAAQTDLHFDCEMQTDRRCLYYRKHIRSCNDHVRMRVTDTNGRYGRSFTHKDGRKRARLVYWKVRDTYSLYNTKAIADMTEVMAITKENVMSKRRTNDQEQAGDPGPDLALLLRDVYVPWAVGQKITRINPTNFAQTIKEQHGIEISARELGIAATEIGLPGKRSHGVRYIVLPDADELDDFRAGVWLPE